MVVVCKPEDSDMWYEKLWNNTVDFFRSLEMCIRDREYVEYTVRIPKIEQIRISLPGDGEAV